MKSPEFVPKSEELKDEERRLSGNDPEHQFVPIDEVPNPGEDVQEEMAKMIDNKKVQKEGDVELYSKKEILKQQIVNDIIKNEKSGFIKSNGSAHFGPEFYDEKKEEVSQKELDPGLVPELAEVEYDNHPYRKSWKESFKDLFKYGFSSRKDRGRNTGEEKDNRTTWNDNKIQKDSRGKLKEIIDNPDNYWPNNQN